MVVRFDPYEVSTPHILYGCLGGFVVLFGMVSLFIREKLYIGEALLAFVFGVIIGPYGANILDPHDWDRTGKDASMTITLEFTRIVLAIGVFAAGVELPKAYMRNHWKSLLFLLGPVKTWGWFVSAGLIYALIPGLDFLSCLAIAACLTPTDPILAAAVVGGKWADKHVPSHLRHLLTAESGCNDGAAFPFLYLSLNLLLYRNVGAALRDWFLLIWFYHVILGILIGSAFGFIFRHLIKFCQQRNLIDRQSYVAQYISLALLTVGVTTILGSDDLLACFCCGVVFAWDGFFNRQTEAVFSSVIDLLFNVGAFVYVGAWTPFSAFSGSGAPLTVWRLIVIAILVMLLRRLPVMVALYKWIPDIKTLREAVFSGHFGPIGISAVFISTLAVEIIRDDDHPKTAQIELLEQTIQPIVSFLVLCSVAIHGLSIPSFSLGRRVHTASRTWSRHAVPDWTNQAKFIDLGADIVINRDSIMEQGQLPTEKGPESETVTLRPLEKDIHGENQNSGSCDETMTERKADSGDAAVQWDAPRQEIVERVDRPSDDVQVEVVHKERGDTHTLESTFGSLLEELQRSVGRREEHGCQSVENQIAAIKAHLRGIMSAPQPAEAPAAEGVDDEEGWVSENETPAVDEQFHRQMMHKGKQLRAKQPIHIVHHHHHHNYRHRGRLSSRRNSISRVEQIPSMPSSTLGDSRQRQSTNVLGRASPYVAEPEDVSLHRHVGLQSSPCYVPSSSTPPYKIVSRIPAAPPFTRPYTADPPLSSTPLSCSITLAHTHDGQPRPHTSGNFSRTGLRRPVTADSAYSRRVEHLRVMHSSPPTRSVSPSRSIRFKDDLGVATGVRTPPATEEELGFKKDMTWMRKIPRSSTK